MRVSPSAPGEPPHLYAPGVVAACHGCPQQNVNVLRRVGAVLPQAFNNPMPACPPSPLRLQALPLGRAAAASRVRSRRPGTESKKLRLAPRFAGRALALLGLQLLPMPTQACTSK
jgi:hypothetical protein